jgi:hypothetical protein
MSKAVRAAVLAVVVLAGCSGGGGKQAVAPTTTTVAPSTTAATPTTQSQEAQVKQAWDDYWTMIVRLSGSPDGNDAELTTRAVDPLLSFLRDNFSTQAAKGERVVIPAGAKYAHQFVSTAISGETATVKGCQLDDAVTVGAANEVIDDSVLSKDIAATFILKNGNWLAEQVQITSQRQGLVGCGS